MQSITGSFYKYRSISGEENKKRLRQMIVDHCIYFARPSTLNDPYDCRPAVIVDASPGQVRKFLSPKGRRQRQKHGLKVKRQEAYRADTRAVLRISDPVQRNKVVFDALDRNTGVFCTSRTAKSNAQWAYYAESHSGVCLEFTINDTTQIFAAPVTYTNDRPNIEILKFLEDNEYRDERIFVAITTKSKHWKHEKEVRFILSKEQLFEYDRTILTGVIFGLATPKSSIDFVRGLLDEAQITPRCRKCSMDENSFKLHLEPLTA